MLAVRWKPELDALQRRWASRSQAGAASSAERRCRPSLMCSSNLVNKVDHLIIGGGMANTFLAARGSMSASRCASMTCRDR
jgi:phosphoglycerate kinase